MQHLAPQVHIKLAYQPCSDLIWPTLCFAPARKARGSNLPAGCTTTGEYCHAHELVSCLIWPAYAPQSPQKPGARLPRWLTRV